MNANFDGTDPAPLRSSLICQRFIKRIKQTQKHQNASGPIRWVLAFCKPKSAFYVQGLYWADPALCMSLYCQKMRGEFRFVIFVLHLSSNVDKCCEKYCLAAERSDKARKPDLKRSQQVLARRLIWRHHRLYENGEHAQPVPR